MGASALHMAAYHGHSHVLKLLIRHANQRSSFDISEHKNNASKTPLAVARESVEFNPYNQDALQVFKILFGRDPQALEMAT